MNNSILLYPSLNERYLKKLQNPPAEYYYLDENKKACPLIAEEIGSAISVSLIKDGNGRWTPDTHNICLKKQYSLNSIQCLFGPEGIACSDAKLGVAIQWFSTDSKQRGVIAVGEFEKNDEEFDKLVEKEFDKAQLRGEIEFSTIIYIAKTGNPSHDEVQLANIEGQILGELEKFSIILDGDQSSFPIFEVSEPGNVLWYVNCDWEDPLTDSFSSTVSINLNIAHKNYPFINSADPAYCKPLLVEIMASALLIIIDKLRSDNEYWDDILNNHGLASGSVAQAINYIMSISDGDLSSDLADISVSLRHYLDKRLVI